MAQTDSLQYAAALWRAVELLRSSPGAGEPQKAALRSLLSLTETQSATIRHYDGILAVDDVALPDDHPDVAPLTRCLRLHGVAEIMVARGAEPAELLALVRGLAADGGHGRVKERLRDAASTRVMLVLERPYELAGAPKVRSVTQAFLKEALDGAVLDEWNKFLATGSETHGGQRIDLGFGDAPEAVAATDPSPGVVADGPDVEAPPPPTRKTKDRMKSVPPGVPSPPARVSRSRRKSLPQPATVQAFSPLGKALAIVLGDPYGADILTQMTKFARCAQDAFAQDLIAEAIDALAIVIDLEAKAPAASQASYAVNIRRILNRSALTQVVPFVLEQKRAGRATVVVRRGGDDALDLVLGLLAKAGTLQERKAYLDVLRGMPRGVDRVLQLLRHDQWQLVRNVAEVVGEERVEQGVAYLAGLLEHQDARVRRAAAVALAKIGSPTTVEAIRGLLSGGAAELKALIAQNVGAHAHGLVSMLVGLAATEENPEVLREYCRALGRVGTPQALRSLEKASQPGGRLLGRKPAAGRLAAIEGLRLAGGPAAQSALESLAGDSDKAIREAANAALEALRARQAATN